MTDLTLPVREAIVAHLKSCATGTPPVVAASIYGEQPPANPAKPYVKYGFPIVTQYEHSGRRKGSTQRVTLHAFTDGRLGTDQVATIVDTFIRYMEQPITPGAFQIVENEWIGTQYLRDGEDYHAVIEFRVTATIGA